MFYPTISMATDKKKRRYGVTLVQRGDSQQGSPHTLCSCHVQISRQECDGCHLCLHSLIIEWGWSMGNLPQSLRRQHKVAGGESWLLVFTRRRAGIFRRDLCPRSFCKENVFLWGDFLKKFACTI